MSSNGNLPAYPTNELQGSAGDYVMAAVGGLTKREAFAMHICAALVGADKPCGGDAARAAVHYADELLAELAKNQAK